jgi:basic membrane protein A and related proteins
VRRAASIASTAQPLRTIGTALAAAALVILFGAVLAPPEGRGATARPLRVGLVLSPGLAVDDFWSGGLKRAVRELGVEGKLLVPSTREGGLPSLRLLAREKYDLVLAATEDPLAAMTTVAREFPRTRFAVLDVHALLPHAPRNLAGVAFAEQEVGYLVGYLAGRMESRRPGPHVVSSVGGVKIPPVDHFIAGYQAGARRAAPGITTLNDYSNSFVDQGKCRPVALAQIAKGSGVVFDVAGYCGYGALAAAKSKGVWAIGVDVDESGRGPFVLTSALKDGKSAVFELIRSTIGGRFAGGRVTEVGLREHAVGIGRISPRVPPRLARELDGIRRQIVAGTIKDIPTTVR